MWQYNIALCFFPKTRKRIHLWSVKLQEESVILCHSLTVIRNCFGQLISSHRILLYVWKQGVFLCKLQPFNFFSSLKSHATLELSQRKHSSTFTAGFLLSCSWNKTWLSDKHYFPFWVPIKSKPGVFSWIFWCVLCWGCFIFLNFG